MLGGAKPPISGRRRGSGVLEEGQSAPSPPAGSWASAVSSQRGPGGGALTVKRFSCILGAPDGLYWNLLGLSSEGGMAPLPPPLNPPMVVVVVVT